MHRDRINPQELANANRLPEAGLPLLVGLG